MKFHEVLKSEKSTGSNKDAMRVYISILLSWNEYETITKYDVWQIKLFDANVINASSYNSTNYEHVKNDQKKTQKYWIL